MINNFFISLFFMVFMRKIASIENNNVGEKTKKLPLKNFKKVLSNHSIDVKKLVYPERYTG